MSPNESMAAQGHARTDGSYDVVIIGSGAGGATLAQRLAKSGKSILILERGPHLPIEEENWNPREVFIKQRYKAHECWFDRKGKPFKPNIHYWVGGNTIFYGAALFRFRKRDFERTEHYGGAISPAWPISYDDLAPYYTEAEILWQVHGKRGSDPTDDAEAPPYAWPPLKHDPAIAQLKSQLNLLGLHPFELPVAVERHAKPWESPCIRCHTCGGFPCLREAKSDGRKMVRRACAYDNVELVIGAKVKRLETAPGGGTVSSVIYETGGMEQQVRGDIVVLAAGAVNTAAILLASHNADHPEGLANGSDQVGRNYMFHTASASLSFALPPVEADFLKTMAINDFYWRDPDGGFDFPMGNIQLLEYLDPDVIRGQIGNTMPAWLLPRWVASMMSKRLIPFLLLTEDLPEQRNRVRLGKDGTIHLEYWYNNLVAHKRLIQRFQDTMKKAGRICKCLEGSKAQMDSIIPLFGTAHQCGTARMGNDPVSSVVDANCKAHEVDNLYICDTSVFVTSTAVNPALTTIANALRIGDIIADRCF